MQDIDYLKLAIGKSKESSELGCFPAGGVVVLDGEILGAGVSDKVGYQHAETSAIDMAFKKHGDGLVGATLYASMEPCIMCLTRAFWVGIRRVVFAISQKNVKKDYYGTSVETSYVVERLNEQIEYIHLKDLEDEALAVVREWEEV